LGRLVKVFGANEMEVGGTKIMKVEGKSIAFFRIGEEFFALDNICLHRGGPLGEGGLDGYRIICPWHGWTYDVRTGAFEIIPALKVKTYAVKKEGDSVFLELDGLTPRSNQSREAKR